MPPRFRSDASRGVSGSNEDRDCGVLTARSRGCRGIRVVEAVGLVAEEDSDPSPAELLDFELFEEDIDESKTDFSEPGEQARC